MQADMTNETHQKSRTETENPSGTSNIANEPAASARSGQAGQFLAWWKEYQKKMQVGVEEQSYEAANARVRVVRYHSRLLGIALPEESAQTSVISIVSNRTRTSAVRVVLAVWLPLTSNASTVMRAQRMSGNQSEPDCKDQPGQKVPPEIPPGALSPPGQRARSGGALGKSKVHGTFP
jgi:hypothetical protein